MRYLPLVILIAVLQVSALYAQDSTAYYNPEDSPMIVEAMLSDNAITRTYESRNCKWDLYQLYSHLLTDYNNGDGVFDFDNPKDLLEKFRAYKILSPTVENILLDAIEDNNPEINIANLVVGAALYDQLNVSKNREHITNRLRSIYPEKMPDFDHQKARFLSGEITFPDFLLQLNFLEEIKVDTIYTSVEIKTVLDDFFSQALGSLGIEVEIREDSLDYILENLDRAYHLPKSVFRYLPEVKSNNSYLTTNYDFYEDLIPYLIQIAKDNNQNISFGLRKMRRTFQFIDVRIFEEPYQYLSQGFDKLVLQSIPRSDIKRYTSFSLTAAKNGVTCGSFVALKSLFITGQIGTQIYISTQDKIDYIKLVSDEISNEDAAVAANEDLAKKLLYPEDLSSFLQHFSSFNYSKREDFGASLQLLDSTERDLRSCLPELFQFLRTEININDITLNRGEVSFAYDQQTYSCRNSESDLLACINEILQDNKMERLIYRLPMVSDQYLHLFYLSAQEKEKLEGLFGTELKLLD